MESREQFTKRALSVALDDKHYLNNSQIREITRAIHNRNPSSLLNEKISRMSVSPSVSTTDKTGSSFQLQLLKKTINRQRLMVGSGDKNLSTLKSELKQLDIQNSKREFWLKQLGSKIKYLEENLTKAIDKQQEEMINREVYLHLLKRMKKTKVFLDIKANGFNQELKVADYGLKVAQMKQMHTQESRIQLFEFYKQLRSTVDEETDMGVVRIGDLEGDLEKCRIVADRREEWKKHRESMFEVAVVEDRSKKNIGLKESVNLHKMWYYTLTALFERKKFKFQKLEEAFQNIKIFTGLGEISAVVENFLTKEFTYAGLLKTVKDKEDRCNEIVEKIQEIKAKVNEIENKEFGKEGIEEAKLVEKKVLRENFELAEKKFLIENVYGKVKAWLRLMVRKFGKIVGKGVVGSEEDRVGFYVQEIRKICKEAIEGHKRFADLGKVVEDNRKLAVGLAISQFAKLPKRKMTEEVLKESELIGC